MILFLFFLLRLTHPTPGIEPGGWIEVCDFLYQFCISNADKYHDLTGSYFREL